MQYFTQIGLVPHHHHSSDRNRRRQNPLLQNPSLVSPQKINKSESAVLLLSDYEAGMCTMMQGSNMVEMGGSPAAAFWGARHSSWGGGAPAGPQPPVSASNQDPKVAEKLMTELQVRPLCSPQ